MRAWARQRKAPPAITPLSNPLCGGSLTRGDGSSLCRRNACGIEIHNHLQTVVMDQVQGLIASFQQIADFLTGIEDETAGEAKLEEARGELAFAKDSAEATLAMLRQWVKDAEDGERSA